MALSVTATLWKESSSTSILEKNLCCINLSPLLVTLPILQQVASETPQIKSILHSVLVKEDIIPCLTMFLNSNISPESDSLSTEMVTILQSVEQLILCLFQAFDLFPSSLLDLLGMLQNAVVLNKAS